MPKYVGILIGNKETLFSSGIIQNTYYIYKCLDYNNIPCRFLCYDTKPEPLEYVNIPLYTLSEDPSIFDPAHYSVVISVRHHIGKTFYDLLKANKVSVVSFICGNSYMTDIEEFVRDSKIPGMTTFMGKGNMCDEVWTIPSYEYMIDYLELTRGKPTFSVPHLWSPEIIQAHLRLKNVDEKGLFFDITKHTKKKIEILIVEPNMYLFKTGWLPICASEKVHIQNPELIENVFCFNYPDNSHAYNMADNLSLGSKLRKFKRIPMPELLDHFNKLDTFPIFVSHQVNNSLNYTYYEILYYGFPLVHNSPDLEGCGYYYPDHNLAKCAEQIMYAYTHHTKQLNVQKDLAKKFLSKIDPALPNAGNKWTQMIRSITPNL